jgi:hypothetical protein
MAVPPPVNLQGQFVATRVLYFLNRSVYTTKIGLWG